MGVPGSLPFGPVVSIGVIAAFTTATEEFVCFLSSSRSGFRCLHVQGNACAAVSDAARLFKVSSVGISGFGFRGLGASKLSKSKTLSPQTLN